MSHSTINTVDPTALRYLMTETVFGVEEREPEAPSETPTAPPFVFFGQNKRNYLFLTHEVQHEWMPDIAMDAFIKTLAALKLAEGDVALLNLATLPEPPTVEQLALFFKPKVVVNLGTPFAWPEQGGISILHTHGFGDMLSDAGKKRDFWTAIKTLLI